VYGTGKGWCPMMNFYDGGDGDKDDNDDSDDDNNNNNNNNNNNGRMDLEASRS
jgi:hypothetical protein